ncbi:hypothetical protein BKA67DRAFT_575917 [Truncatella angustata]|uniref:Chitinase domain-containing protein 1 n=1 Tax=Truncatella angustata TaxID=152316 RepID=A0A9P8UF40_9PEZI|nr:uncharacterized protein BKA67DRAFT_575917 [Truncatella angustata]KAH6648812.1 hypothetical protein BKA67DRAFT_575917 [Truncatella angustata]KAH8200875.1 hypothetical protein TruAng_004961 [Truncatella angustata]
MELTRRTVRLILLVSHFIAVAHCRDQLDVDDHIPFQLNDDNARRHPELPVLGYVTPWNPRGKDLVEEHRQKFDIVCPVWYTVHPSSNDVEVYEVRGGPPADEDRDWYKRLQTPSDTKPKAIQVTPRFILDGWSQDDYRQLMFNETRWHRLATEITQVVEDMAYNGIVFESGATHALSGPLGVLSDHLKENGKTLVLVMPPIRTTLGMGDAAALNSHNAMMLQSISSLAGVADYFSIMTYDMTGPGGHESLRQFPRSSQLHAAQQQHKVREPGPNTNVEWVGANLIAFTDAAKSQDGYTNEQQFVFKDEVSAKFLMGLPLYGYKYPVFLADDKKGIILQSTESVNGFSILRGAGEPVVMHQIEELIAEYSPKLEEMDDGEFYFDYSAEDGLWRVFLPTPESMSNVLGVLDQNEHIELGAGIALWEVGQSSLDLLVTL